MSSLPSYARHTEWWEHKITLFLFTGLLAISYATPGELWWPLLQLGIVLLAIIVCAIFVSVINDYTDMEDDRIAGKTNRLTHLSLGKIRLIIFGLLASGAVFCWYFRNQPVTIFFYAGSWIAYSAYSFPPIRLKRRGWSGVLADASGAHLFPTLTILSAMSHSLLKPFPPELYLTAAGWNILFGLRGILWHQYTDRQNDLTSGVKTLATLLPSSVIARMELPILLLEITALVSMLWIAELQNLLYLFPVYLAYVWLIRKRMQLHPVIILVPEKKEWIFLCLSFYQTILPLGLMILMSVQLPWVLLLIPIHILLFSNDIRANLSITEDVVRNLLKKR
jgi:4-hydroxybenzoate polyprenyltransferase